ncbi:hypothetical protein J2T13_001267 [Paenibacillus sp. DS2015]|uniref:hypothetical protein n=1 Tax=Paenibacillus sp. DS2015 TaxID=3373917 RepID=UPI003D215B2F
MVVLVGIMCYVLLCSSIIILSAIAISLYQQEESPQKKKDPYSYLFEVYDE